MKTLKESILDKDFDIDELGEISIALSPIYKYAWRRTNRTTKIITSPNAINIFEDILGIIQHLIKNTKRSKLAKVDVYCDKSESVIYIIEKKVWSGPATGVRISLEKPGLFEEFTTLIYANFNFDARKIAAEMKKIGSVPYAVMTNIIQKLELS